MDEASHVRSSKFGTYRKTPLRSCDVYHVKRFVPHNCHIAIYRVLKRERERENALSDT